MNTEILAYLSSAKPDFDSGFALFCKYSRNRTAKDWIARRHDMPKLIYELGKLAKTTVADTSSVPSVEMALFTPSPAPAPAPVAGVAQEVRKLTFRTFDDRRTRRSELPPDLQEVFDRNAEDYKLRRGFHEKMKMALSDADRAHYRALVLETDARIRAGWDRIDDYFASVKEQEVKEAPFDEMRCRRYVSKVLHLDSPSPSQIADCKARLKALLEHDCVIKPQTLKALEEKGLL